MKSTPFKLFQLQPKKSVQFSAFHCENALPQTTPLKNLRAITPSHTTSAFINVKSTNKFTVKDDSRLKLENSPQDDRDVEELSFFLENGLKNNLQLDRFRCINPAPYEPTPINCFVPIDHVITEVTAQQILHRPIAVKAIKRV